jgi:hypothetical protein
VRRLLCAMALIVSCCTPAAADGLDEPAATYYERCVGASARARVPDADCDDLIWKAFGGVVIAEANQERPHVCFPRDLDLERMQALFDESMREHPKRPPEKTITAISETLRQVSDRLRAAVAAYMHEHPERLSEKTSTVIFAAFRHAFPCPD